MKLDELFAEIDKVLDKKYGLKVTSEVTAKPSPAIQRSAGFSYSKPVAVVEEPTQSIGFLSEHIPGTANPTGDICTCGGLMVQTGKCRTCQWCGKDSGGCS